MKTIRMIFAAPFFAIGVLLMGMARLIGGSLNDPIDEASQITGPQA